MLNLLIIYYNSLLFISKVLDNQSYKQDQKKNNNLLEHPMHPRDRYRKSKAIKGLRNQIEVLEKQVSISRVAVENIAKCAVMEGKYKQNIENLQEDLHHYILKLTQQSSKNALLTQIIKDQKKNLFQYQQVDQKSKEAQMIRKDKELICQQTRIDKILKRYNEEIAGIRKLKQMTDCWRSQRVVCSNLFKKLEKQIKYHEEIYKKELLNGQFLRKKAEQLMPKDHKTTFISRQPTLTSQKSKTIETIVHQNYQYTDQDSQSQTPSLILFSNNRHTFTSQDTTKNHHRYDSKFHSIRSSKEKDQNYRKASVKQERLMMTKELLGRIGEYEALVEGVKVICERKDTEELIKHYKRVQQENLDLMEEINKYDEKIELKEREMSLFEKQQRERMAQLEKEDSLQSFNTAQLLGFQVNSMKMLTYDEEIERLNQQLDEIANIFDYELEKNSSNIPTQHSIKILDQKISALCLYAFPHNKKKHNQQDNLFSETIVFCLLQKMQKYPACQKIMDGKVLREEYYRQLGTRKNIRTRKHIGK